MSIAVSEQQKDHISTPPRLCKSTELSDSSVSGKDFEQKCTQTALKRRLFQTVPWPLSYSLYAICSLYFLHLLHNI